MKQWVKKGNGLDLICVLQIMIVLDQRKAKFVASMFAVNDCECCSNIPKKV